MDSETNYDNERIIVNLKMLVDLAKPAAALNIRPNQIKAAQSGAYLSHFKGFTNLVTMFDAWIGALPLEQINHTVRYFRKSGSVLYLFRWIIGQP